MSEAWILFDAIRSIVGIPNLGVSTSGEVNSEETFQRFVEIDNAPSLTWAEVKAKMDEMKDAWKLEKALEEVRLQRNVKLQETDHYFVGDYVHSSEDAKEAWKTYRQQLRDLPNNSPDAQINLETGELTGVVWPAKPE
jgi:hypothetical protein